MKLNKISILIFVLALCSTQISKSMYGSRGISAKEAREIARKKNRFMKLNEMLFQAADSNDYKTAKHVIDEGADVNFQQYMQNPPLYAAAEHEYLEIVQLLINNRADPDIRGILGYTPIMIAAQNGNLDIVKFLLNNGADMNIIYDRPYAFQNMNTIQMAEAKDHPNVANFLKEYKAKRAKETQEATQLIPDLVNIVEEYEGYKKPKNVIECKVK